MKSLDELYVVEIYLENNEIQLRQYETQYNVKPYFIQKTGLYEISKNNLISEIKSINYDFSNKYLYCSTLEELVYIFINGIYLGVSAQEQNDSIIRSLN